jgi:tetratricopeptide (TPR) repeat protein
MGYPGKDKAGHAGVRPIFWVGLALVGLSAFAVGVFLLRERLLDWRRGVHAEHAREDSARSERAQPVAAVALAPLPVKSPLIERPGTDADGYPRSYVDQAALCALLGREKFSELSAYIEQFQRAFEVDFHDEFWMSDASDAFDSPDPALTPRFDAWVQATPGSFVPYLARAMHHFGAGWAARGGKFSRDTDQTSFSEMRKSFELAQADLKHALQLSPHLVAAVRIQMRIAFAESAEQDFQALANSAFQLCPPCMQPRITEQVRLEPRWGGSYGAMAEAARSAPIKLNSRMKQLAGYADMDRASVLLRDNKLPEAMLASERACKLGENSDFLDGKADILEQQGDTAGAIAALDKAVDLRPGRAELLLARANAECRKGGDYRACYRDLVAGMHVDPSDHVARNVLPIAVKGLTFEGWQAHTQGKEDEAIELLDKAAELDPNHDVESRRFAVLTSGFTGTDAEVTALESKARAAPHDFYAHERLDYALSKRREWPRIAAMWAVYIADNPEDARAYLERSGTYHQLGQAAASHADAERACQLGSSAGCSYAKRP